MKTVLLVIDPQNDFVDAKGSLYVKGSEDAIQNLADYIRECSKDDSIYRIVVSQDTHTKVNVGFSDFWKGNPEWFTKITAEDIRQKKFVPANMTVDAEEIAKHLDERGQVITIWPPHCMEETWGVEFPSEIRAALGRWMYTRKGENNTDNFNLLVKGTGIHEAYSILDCCRSAYGTKSGFDEIIDTFIKDGVEVIEICGFCTDVCVKYSTHDLVAELINRFNKGEKVPHKIEFLPECSKAIGDDLVANAEIEAMLDSYNGLFS